jgi:hypothetical protein
MTKKKDLKNPNNWSLNQTKVSIPKKNQNKKFFLKSKIGQQ